MLSYISDEFKHKAIQEGDKFFKSQYAFKDKLKKENWDGSTHKLKPMPREGPSLVEQLMPGKWDDNIYSLEDNSKPKPFYPAIFLPETMLENRDELIQPAALSTNHIMTKQQTTALMQEKMQETRNGSSEILKSKQQETLSVPIQEKKQEHRDGNKVDSKPKHRTASTHDKTTKTNDGNKDKSKQKKAA